MGKVIELKSFKKDIIYLKKRQWHNKFKKLDVVLANITSGNMKALTRDKYIIDPDLPGCRECHIEWDLILIYKVVGVNRDIILIRIGKHDDIYKKSWASRKHWLGSSRYV